MKYGKALARSIDCSKSLAKQALKDPEARKWLCIGIGKVMMYEVKRPCSDKTESILRSKSKEDVSNFP